MMKSVKTCPLIAVLGLYLMSNSLSSMTHCTSVPEVYGLCSICFDALSESRWCELGSMVEVFWRWSPMLELAVPSSDTFPLLISELGCSNRPAAVLYPIL